MDSFSFLGVHWQTRDKDYCGKMLVMGILHDRGSLIEYHVILSRTAEVQRAWKSVMFHLTWRHKETQNWSQFWNCVFSFLPPMKISAGNVNTILPIFSNLLSNHLLTSDLPHNSLDCVIDQTSRVRQYSRWYRLTYRQTDCMWSENEQDSGLCSPATVCSLGSLLFGEWWGEGGIWLSWTDLIISNLAAR